MNPYEEAAAAMKIHSQVMQSPEESIGDPNEAETDVEGWDVDAAFAEAKKAAEDITQEDVFPNLKNLKGDVTLKDIYPDPKERMDYLKGVLSWRNLLQGRGLLAKASASQCSHEEPLMRKAETNKILENNYQLQHCHGTEESQDMLEKNQKTEMKGLDEDMGMEQEMEAMCSGLGWAGWAGLVAGLVLVAIIR